MSRSFYCFNIIVESRGNVRTNYKKFTEGNFQCTQMFFFPVEFFKIILHFLFLIPKAFAGKKVGVTGLIF